MLSEAKKLEAETNNTPIHACREKDKNKNGFIFLKANIFAFFYLKM